MTEAEISIEERLLDALERGAAEEIVALASQLHPADVAAFLRSLDEEQRSYILSNLDRDTVVEAMEHLPAPGVASALTDLSEEEQRQVLENLPDDELVDLLQEVASHKKEEYLSLLSESKKAVSSDLLRFPENTAGGRMTMAFATLRPEMTIEEAIESLVEIREATEVLSRIFVVDEDSHLLGKVRLRDLTFNPRDQLIREIMDDDTTSVDAFADQEEAARMIARYDLVALPVVDENSRLLGVVTHDDALEILQEESTEDIEKFSAIAGTRGETNYLQTPVPVHFRRRFFWILPLALLAIFSGVVIYSYEQVLNEVYLLVVYLPMVVAAGGNTGSQAATTVIRAMSLGEFEPTAVVKVVWKELRIGFLLGGLLGLCVGLFINFVMPFFIVAPPNISVTGIAGVVGLALTGQVMSSTLLGALLPIMARASRLDPAVVASPAITTLVDVTGLVIYFALAKVLLGL